MTWVDDRKPAEETKSKPKIHYARKIREPRDLTMPVRPEKVEEIRTIWKAPEFKTHNQRLDYLLRHCTIIEPQYGYTIREFMHGIHPQKMDLNSTGEYDDEIYAQLAVRQMLRRFNHVYVNRGMYITAVLARGTGKWYYYNIYDNGKEIKDLQLRMARIYLGEERVIQELKDIVEHSEDVEKLYKARFEEIAVKAEAGRKQMEKEKEEKNKNPLKFKKERAKDQGTLD